jgi:hypothetical protein
LFVSSSRADCFFNLRGKNLRRVDFIVSLSLFIIGDSEFIFDFIHDLRLCIDSDFERFKFFFEDFFLSFSFLLVVVVVDEISETLTYK